MVDTRIGCRRDPRCISEEVRQMDNRMTRREGLQRALTAAGAAALSPSLLARVARAQGKAQVTVGLPADIFNFDPSTKAFVTYPVIRQVYNKLLDYTVAYQPVPDLALSW